MINSSLRRTALLAVVVSALSLRAAAQGDAGLSAAFQGLGAPLAALAQLKTVSQVPPAPVSGPAADPVLWQRLVDVVVARGERKAVTGTSASVYFITREVTLTKGDQWLYLVQIGGIPLPDGRVEIVSASISYMHYVTNLTAGTETTYTRAYSTDGNGRLVAATDMESVAKLQPPDSKSIDGPKMALNINDPKIAADFAGVVGFMTK